MLKTNVTLLNITPLGKGGKGTAQVINAIRKFTTNKKKNGLKIELLVRKERVNHFKDANTDKKTKKNLPTIKIVVAGPSQKNISETVEQINQFTRRHYAVKRPGLSIELSIQKRETSLEPLKAIKEFSKKGINSKIFSLLDF